MDSLPLPYITQTAYPANRHSPDCMSTVLCRTISDCPAKQFKVRLCIRPCAPVSLLFYSRVPKTLEHSRSLKFTRNNMYVRMCVCAWVCICVCACVCAKTVHGCVCVCACVCHFCMLTFPLGSHPTTTPL